MRLVPRVMRGVFELHFWEALVVVDGAVSDELDLRDARKPSESAIEYVLFVLLDLVVPVPEILSGWIECL